MKLRSIFGLLIAVTISTINIRAIEPEKSINESSQTQENSYYTPSSTSQKIIKGGLLATTAIGMTIDVLTALDPASSWYTKYLSVGSSVLSIYSLYSYLKTDCDKIGFLQAGSLGYNIKSIKDIAQNLIIKLFS